MMIRSPSRARLPAVDAAVAVVAGAVVVHPVPADLLRVVLHPLRRVQLRPVVLLQVALLPLELAAEVDVAADAVVAAQW